MTINDKNDYEPIIYEQPFHSHIYENQTELLVKLMPLKTTSRLATAQGSTLIYGKIQLFLNPTKTMEQNKLLNKPFKQTFHITDMK